MELDVELKDQINEKTAKSPHKRWGLQLLILPTFLFLIIFFIVPLFKVLLNSLYDPTFTLKNYLLFFKEPAYTAVLFNTLRMGILVTLITLVLGYPVAYMLSQVSSRARNILLIFVLLPFWTSFLVRTYAWIVILEKEGVVNRILLSLGIIHEPLQLVHNSVGVMIGLSHVLLPFMILPLFSVMKNIEMDLVKAAQSLGGTPFQSFVKVFFPLSIPGIAAGSILVFIICIGYYVTPALLGGGKDTMISQLIAQQIGEQLNWGFGSAIAVVLLLAVLILLYLFNKFIGLDKISFGP